MECKTARLLQSLAVEIGPIESEELLAHLESCTECAAEASAERRLDARIGKAMNDVPVPAGLKGRIHGSLAEARWAEWSKAASRWVAPLAAAAALLFVVGLTARILTTGWKIDPEDLLAGQNMYRPGNAEAAEAVLRRLGSSARVPQFTQYAHLSGVSISELPGHPGRIVPALSFAYGAKRATVYVIDTWKMTMPSETVPDEGYVYRVRKGPHEDERWAYLILYTGGRPDWLYR
jgi:hypothetical protein